MKKILFYLNSMKPAGGIERVVSTLANQLSENYNIDILVKDESISFYQLNNNISIKSIGSYEKLNMNSRLSRAFSFVKSYVVSTLKMRRYLDRNKYDYIYVTTPLNFWEVISTFKSNNNVIASEHGARVNYNFIYKLLKKGYKFSYKYIVPTTDDAHYYSENGYPVLYIPHLRPELNYNKSELNNKRVLSVGRFTDDKQHLLLIDIWIDIQKTNDKFKEWKLVLVGDGELKDEISNKIKMENIDNIEILKPQKNISDIYKNASLFVLTSSSEGFGMVLLEALSFGLPVISFDCPSGPRDIITNGKDGYLISNFSNYEYKEKLKRLLTDASLREAMSIQGFEKGDTWNENNILKRWKEIL
ncbi:glycosyltransferase [Photobacterium phosphoreum]|uniref:glycosyltransferase family 4 protein n=1 Tax=Photobacterium phosphoreum TaxID=659 RepID=UPI001E58633C|nr:glycosyltransferase family 4 protein [Photobacterium phosphoreum]MCD9504171.1 glycosyltransferase [Photobacterium phosphoreum]